MESGIVSRDQVGARHWQRPLAECVKCNLNASWRNASLHSGGAWIARNHYGDVLFHARDAFTCSPNTIIAELCCAIWTLQSLRDLRLMYVVIGLDCHAAFQALHKPTERPRYRFLLIRLVSFMRALMYVLLSWKHKELTLLLELTQRVLSGMDVFHHI